MAGTFVVPRSCAGPLAFPASYYMLLRAGYSYVQESASGRRYYEHIERGIEVDEGPPAEAHADELIRKGLMLR